MGDSEQGDDGCDRLRESAELFNPCRSVGRDARERRLPAGAQERTGGEHGQAIAAKALNGDAEGASDHRADEPPEAWRRRNEIGQGDEMDESRQPKILLRDVEMGGRRVAQTRRKAAVVGHGQRGAQRQ